MFLRLTVKRITADCFELNGARHENGYITGISSDNNSSASLKIKVSADGIYALTVKYSNDGEGGLHDYNVDLIEKYATININGKEIGNYYFRNTYSLDTVKTKTLYVFLSAGENEIVFSNNGAYKFNDAEAFAPEIYSLTVAGVKK